jgi:hypothetical protein
MYAEREGEREREGGRTHGRTGCDALGVYNAEGYRTERAPRCHDLGRKRRRLGEIVSHSSLSRALSRASLAARSFPHQRRGITFSFRFYLASTAAAPLPPPIAPARSSASLSACLLCSPPTTISRFLLAARSFVFTNYPGRQPSTSPPGLSHSLLPVAITIPPPIIRRLAKRVSPESPSQ